MNTSEITTFLRGVNVTQFAQDHKLPLRTLVRLKAGNTAPRAGTKKLIEAAIGREQRKAAKVDANVQVG